MIAYFVYNLNSYSGAAQQAYKLANSIDNKVLFFNFNNSKIEKLYKNDNIIVNMGKNKVFNIFAIVYYTFSYKLKIYHLHGFFQYGLILGYILKRTVILKTTMMGDDDFASLQRKKFGSFKLYLINKTVNTNIVLTNKMRDVNSKLFNKSKIRKIPNGVDIDLEQVIEKEKNSFCFVGLICDRKNTLESIKYFNNFYKNLDDAKLYIVGPYKDIINIPDFSDSYVDKCFKYIKDNDLQKQVIFTGQLSKEKTYEVYKKSKALLFFSKKEGMPNVVIEAMSHNCVPILSSLDGVSKEIIKNELNGFILSSDTQLAVDIVKINEIIKKSYPQKRIKESYLLSEIAILYKNLYLENKV